jgi:hypothetical protein
MARPLPSLLILEQVRLLVCRAGGGCEAFFDRVDSPEFTVDLIDARAEVVVALLRYETGPLFQELVFLLQQQAAIDAVAHGGWDPVQPTDLGTVGE